MNPKTLNDSKRNPKVSHQNNEKICQIMKMVDRKGGQKLNKVDRKVDRKFKMILKAKKMTLKKQRMTPIIDE